jgi:hypothetical protein
MYSHVKYPSFLKIELIRKENEKLFCIFAVFSKKKAIFVTNLRDKQWQIKTLTASNLFWWSKRRLQSRQGTHLYPC